MLVTALRNTAATEISMNVIVSALMLCNYMINERQSENKIRLKLFNQVDSISTNNIENECY